MGLACAHAAIVRMPPLSLILASIVVAATSCKGPRSEPDAGPAVVGASDTSAAKAPPALRAAHLSTPALPDLPALGAHEAPDVAPKSAAPSSGSCRSVWTGSDSAPLSCWKAALFAGLDESGVRMLVPDSLLDAEADALPAIVDHRQDGTEGPIRNQSSTPACTAFAIAAALDHAVARWTGKATQVSVMEIWSRYHEPEERTAIQSNLNTDLGAESDWAFSVNEANAWLPCPSTGKPPKSGCGLSVDPLHVKKVEAAPIATFNEVERLKSVDVTLIKSKIAGGQDVIAAMLVPDTFSPKGKAGARYIPHYTSAPKDSGHAVVLSGYATLPHGTYFLIHNSWGTGWGDGGYAWIHEATVTKWTEQAVVVDAEPKQRDPSMRPKRSRGETTCAAGLVPDSIRGTCAAPCTDGSPRHDGVCPVKGQCPTGLVNLTGTCVLAAPSVTGSDPSTGIAWKCGPGGCTYTLPRASDPACTGNTCLASCPAPDFRVARDGTNLTCVE